MDNRRAHTRLKLELKESAELPDERKAPIFDISKGGACFLSIQEYQPGDNITVKTGKMTMTMEVLECRLIEVERDLDDFRYRIRCRHVSGDVLEMEPFFEVIST